MVRWPIRSGPGLFWQGPSLWAYLPSGPRLLQDCAKMEKDHSQKILPFWRSFSGGALPDWSIGWWNSQRTFPGVLLATKVVHCLVTHFCPWSGWGRASGLSWTFLPDCSVLDCCRSGPLWSIWSRPQFIYLKTFYATLPPNQFLCSLLSGPLNWSFKCPILLTQSWNLF